MAAPPNQPAAQLKLSGLLSRLNGAGAEAQQEAKCAGWDLTSDQVAQLAQALEDTSLERLDLRANYAGVNGAKAIGVALEKGHNRLKEINLSDNVLCGRYLSDKGQTYEELQMQTAPDTCGIEQLFRGAIASRDLRILDLSYNHLGPDGAQLIGAFFATAEPGSLAHLSVVLGFNKITHDGAKAIVDALRRPVSGASSKPVLGELNLRNNNLRPEGAAAIADAIRVGSDGCALSLRSLILYNDHLLAKGARHIAQGLEADARGQWNPFLEHIDLSSNCLGTAGGCAIAQALAPRAAQPPAQQGGAMAYNSTLRSVRLHRNNISDGGAEAFAALIAENTALTSLALSNNHIHDVGGALMAEALKANTRLRELDLSRNHFTQEVEQRLAAAVEQRGALEVAAAAGGFAPGCSGDGPAPPQLAAARRMQSGESGPPAVAAGEMLLDSGRTLSGGARHRRVSWADRRGSGSGCDLQRAVAEWGRHNRAEEEAVAAAQRGGGAAAAPAFPLLGAGSSLTPPSYVVVSAGGLELKLGKGTI